ncbi:hypothetical protein NQ317_003759, partial [Molorchus minor]
MQGDEMEDSVIGNAETGFLEAAQGSQNQVGELSHLIVWQVSTVELVSLAADTFQICQILILKHGAQTKLLGFGELKHVKNVAPSTARFFLVNIDYDTLD